jgi:hypothetical protein
MKTLLLTAAAVAIAATAAQAEIICTHHSGCYETGGYFNVEAVRSVTGKSLPGLRKHGESLAQHFGVDFLDRTERG